MQVDLTVQNALELIQLPKKSPTPGDFTTCMVMYGSGVRTGTGKTIRLVLLSTQRGLHRVRTGCTAVVVGATTPGKAGQQFASGPGLTTLTSSWGSGLLFPQAREPGGARNRTPQSREDVAAQALRWSAERSQHFFIQLFGVIRGLAILVYNDADSV